MSSETNSRADAILETEGLKKYFDQSEGFLDRVLGNVGKVKAVDGVDLTLREGETLAVVGESGCGKSTLGQTLLNLHIPTDGTIRYRGEDITGLSGSDMRPYRRDMQMIFQDPLASLNPRQTVGQIIKAPMEVHGIADSDDERTERAEQLLERVGLKASHMDRYPPQFSGGQQQRVGVGRALTVEPDLLIADEPVSALDVSVQAQILNLLDELQDELSLSMLFITHDLSVVRQIADRVAVMYLGEIVEMAPVERLFDDPQHPYTKSLLSAVPRINPDARTERVILEGSVPSPLDPPKGCRFHTRCPVIIPPEDWSDEQETFRQAFSFRVRVEEEDLDPEAVREHLEAEKDGVTDDDVADQLVDGALRIPPDELPPDVERAVHETARLVAVGEEEGAVEHIRKELTSPCVDERPRQIEAETDHLAACHRVDPEWAVNQEL